MVVGYRSWRGLALAVALLAGCGGAARRSAGGSDAGTSGTGADTGAAAGRPFAGSGAIGGSSGFGGRAGAAGALSGGEPGSGGLPVGDTDSAGANSAGEAPGGTNSGGVDTGGVSPGGANSGGVTLGGANSAGSGGTVCGSPTDPRNCGRCGHDCTTLPYVAPDKMECRAGECIYGPDACLPGFAHCVNTPDRADLGCTTDLSEISSCGACSVSCPFATRLCASAPLGPAMCVSACPASTTLCELKCSALQSDPDNCGACGRACRENNGGGICVAGECVLAGCFAGYADCSSAQGGCETYLSTFDDCARCGDDCSAAHAEGRCENSHCVRTCAAGFGDCDSASPDCETPLESARNCGACGSSCPSDRPVCGVVVGVRACVSSCAAPVADRCGTACVDLATDLSHCGACDAACETYQTCEAGACTPRYVGTAVVEGAVFSKTVALGPDGSYAVGGRVSNSVDFDPGPDLDFRGPAAGEIAWEDVFVSRFNADDSYAWTRVVGGPEEDGLGGMATASDGSVLVNLWFNNSVDFDSGAALASLTAGGANQHALLKLAANGSFVWAKTFPLSGPEAVGWAGAFTIDPAGALYAAGGVQGQVDLDPGSGTRALSGTGSTGYLVKLSAAGDLLWAQTFPDCEFLYLLDAKVASDGTLWAGGSFQGECDLDPGVGMALAPSTQGAFILHLNSETGAYLGSQTLTRSDSDGVVSIAFDSDGSRYFSGASSANNGFELSAFLIKTDSSGARQWLKTYDHVNGGFAITPARAGGVVLGGTGNRGPGPRTQGMLMSKVNPSGGVDWSIDLRSRNSGVNGLASTSQGFLAVGTVSDYGADVNPGARVEHVSKPAAFVTRYLF